MPKKITFSVVYATGEHPKYKHTELNTHGPTVRGWQSAKDCEFPQEIVLRLDRRCLLNKIQILAHQYLITTKIELFFINEDTNTVTRFDDVSWEYLGYITLSDNQNTSFKSRELKSVNVPPAEATFLKLKLGKNHPNLYNVGNQVSLIAVNVLGMEVEKSQPSGGRNETTDRLNAMMNDPDYDSPYEDLAFEMYVDTDVAKIIREMEIKKHLAVISERFEYARKLKLAMASLRGAGERLGKYELEKRHAIEREDYERARQKKNQMEEFRANVYREQRVDQLLEIDGVCSKNDQCVDDVDGAKSSLSPTAMQKSGVEKRSASPHVSQQGFVSPLHMPKHQSPKSASPNTGSPTNAQTRGGSFRRRNKSAGAIIKSTYEQYEEKPLPALRHSQTNEFLRECHSETEFKTASKLTEREKKQAALPMLVFGGDLVERFYSKQYSDKEDGLNMLKEELITYDGARMHTANKTGRAAIFLLHRALRDKVFSVYSLANEVIRLFFVQFVPGRVSPAEVGRSVDKLLPELLTKSGDTSTRIHHMAVHTILTMADCKNVRELHIIPVHLSRPVNSSTHPRLALSRAEMVEQLIINHGISVDKQSGLTCRTLSEFGLSGLHHPAEAVRKVAERILVLVYKVNPRLVRKQLPPDDDITRRNLLYRQLFHEFDKIDLQRKKEMLERNRLIQQSSIAANSDCLSPEPAFETKADINKCHSSSNLQNVIKPHPLSKSVSGGDIVQSNGHAKRENESGSSASGVSSPSNGSQKDDEEKRCIFCNQPESGILTSNNSMNSHYWRTCPMLVRCHECNQVVEVAALTEHCLMECDSRESYTQCFQCLEAVKVENYDGHVAECTEATEGFYRCPLCHENVDVEESGWKSHLMGEKPCKKNARIKSHQSKQVTIQT